jgi:hypothetical protein
MAQTTPQSRWSSPLLFIGVLALASAVLGWFIPAFYQWTGSNQSRTSPWVGRTALVMISGGAAMAALLPWMPLQTDLSGTERGAPWRFSLKLLVVITGLVAILTAGLLAFPVVLSWLLYAAALVHCSLLAWKRPHHRWPFAGLLACMYLPFVWLLGGELRNLGLGLLWHLAGLPMLLPGALITNWSGGNMHEGSWVPFVLSAAELEVGMGLMASGPKKLLAYLIAVMLISLFSSFGLHALVLA